MSVLEDEARQSLQPWIEIHDAHGDKMSAFAASSGGCSAENSKTLQFVE